MKILIAAFIFITGFSLVNGEKDTELKQTETQFEIKNDEEEYTLVQVLDENNLPRYYYRDIEKFPCHREDVCRLMKVRLYWDIFGNYLQYELLEEETLTKLNHKEFSERDYNKLHKILNNPGSELKFCKYENLTSHEAENTYHSVDAVSSATVQTHKFEYINGAIKTTWVLWHLVHGSSKDEIRKKTLQAFDLSNNKTEITSDFDLSALHKLSLNQQINVLHNLSNTDKLDNDQLTEQLANLLYSENDQLFTVALELLRQRRLMNKLIKKKLASHLINDDDLKLTLAYNYLLLNHEKSTIKKVSLPHKTVTL